MKLFNRYILIIYIKFLLIIFFALQLFYVGLDLITNYSDLPPSANLQILYMFYKFIEASKLTLPISLIFSMIFTKLSLIKSSELIAMFSLGISKNKSIKPIFVVSILILMLHISLSFTSLVYAKEYSKNILKYSKTTTNTKDIFIKHFNSYIYIKSLSIYDKKAYNILIYQLNNSNLERIIRANSAVFRDDSWILQDVTITNKKTNLAIGKKALEITTLPSFQTLKNFDPKIIDNMFSNSDSVDILDTLKTLKIFYEQNLDTNQLKTSLYSSLVFPFFASFILLIFFYYIPTSGRFFSLSLVSSLLISGSLVVWAILFILIELSRNRVINPELGIVLPILMLSFFALKLYNRHKISNFMK